MSESCVDRIDSKGPEWHRPGLPECPLFGRYQGQSRTASAAALVRPTSPAASGRSPSRRRPGWARPSGDFPPDVGEPAYLGLKFAPSVDIKPPRLADAPWSMECKTWQVINVKDDRQLIMGEGLRFHIRDELWDPKAMRVHMEKYHPIGRMFADRYCRTDDRVIFPAAEGPKKAAAAD